MANVEPEWFDFRKALDSTVTAYRDVYKERLFEIDCDLTSLNTSGSPELLIQMLDKLIDNAVDFSNKGDTITIRLLARQDELELSVTNPGPPLPERMRTQMFDSMVSMRSGDNTRHLGLGLYVARLIAAGHGGRIDADNVAGGVMFRVVLPMQTKG
jgi:signal transduction histidine kinase